MTSSTKQYLVIAAIDFGTTYSGYAYAFLHDLRKTDQAENTYAELADDDEHQNWRFFKHIKMMLHSRNIHRTTKLQDDQGKSMVALDVFSAAIRYLKDDIMHTLKNRITNILDNEVKWVITVPAIWNYKAKQFMKEAAVQAGIDARLVCLAHEPEAAAIFCKHVEVCKTEDSKGNFKLECFKKGSQFMILDLGGGTVDITACEVQGDGSLKELCPRGGGPWGGTVVDAHLYNCLENAIRKKVMDSFSKTCKWDHLKLRELIEQQKRLCMTASTTMKDPTNPRSKEVRIDLPSALFTIYEKQQNETLAKTLGRERGKPCIKRTKICFPDESFSAAFKKPTESIIKEIRSLISKNNLHRLNTFMMVGGFSESPIIQQAVRDAFPEKIVIIPEETSTAVLKGAVLYGYQSSNIHSRMLPYSFGISTCEQYDAQRHRGVTMYEGNEVEDVFCPYVKKGSTVTEEGIEVLKMFGNKSSVIEIYQTPVDNLADPEYTYKEHFECIGLVKFDSSVYAKTVDVKMNFGIHGIKVSARPTGTKEWTEKSFDAL
ncbi:Heat shock 70 kDa protein 12A [Mactra antiquata]